MKEKEMITPENFNEVEKYLKENYTFEFGYTFKMKDIIGRRVYDSIDGFSTLIRVHAFLGKRSRYVSAQLLAVSNKLRDFNHDKVSITRVILTLDDLKELESKVAEINEFVKRLGIWL